VERTWLGVLETEPVLGRKDEVVLVIGSEVRLARVDASLRMVVVGGVGVSIGVEVVGVVVVRVVLEVAVDTVQPGVVPNAVPSIQLTHAG